MANGRNQCMCSETHKQDSVILCRIIKYVLKSNQTIPTLIAANKQDISTVLCYN